MGRSSIEHSFVCPSLDSIGQWFPCLEAVRHWQWLCLLCWRPYWRYWWFLMSWLDWLLDEVFVVVDWEVDDKGNSRSLYLFSGIVFHMLQTVQLNWDSSQLMKEQPWRWDRSWRLNIGTASHELLYGLTEADVNLSPLPCCCIECRLSS